MIHSEQFGKLATALAKAQGVIEDAIKDKTNPHFKSSYADLASVRAAVQKPLSENGIACVQLLSTSADGLDVQTMLIHGESGEYIGETLTVPLGQRSAQAVGSAASYGRRYGLMAIVGIAADDDDGNAAQAAAPQNGQKTTRGPDWGKSAQAKRRGDWGELENDLRDCGSAVAVGRLQADYRANQYPQWSKAWQEQAEELFEKRWADFTGEDLAKRPGEALTLREQLQGSVEAETPAPEPATRNDYLNYCAGMAATLENDAAAKTWWAEQAAARRRFRISPAEESDIRAAIRARLDEARHDAAPRNAALHRTPQRNAAILDGQDNPIPPRDQSGN